MHFTFALALAAIASAGTLGIRQTECEVTVDANCMDASDLRFDQQTKKCCEGVEAHVADTGVSHFLPAVPSYSSSRRASTEQN